MNRAATFVRPLQERDPTRVPRVFLPFQCTRALACKIEYMRDAYACYSAAVTRATAPRAGAGLLGLLGGLFVRLRSPV
jgi:hypothetical protein